MQLKLMIAYCIECWKETHSTPPFEKKVMEVNIKECIHRTQEGLEARACVLDDVKC